MEKRIIAKPSRNASRVRDEPSLCGAVEVGVNEWKAFILIQARYYDYAWAREGARVSSTRDVCGDRVLTKIKIII